MYINSDNYERNDDAITRFDERKRWCHFDKEKNENWKVIHQSQFH